MRQPFHVRSRSSGSSVISTSTQSIRSEGGSTRRVRSRPELLPQISLHYDLWLNQILDAKTKRKLRFRYVGSM